LRRVYDGEQISTGRDRAIGGWPRPRAPAAHRDRTSSISGSWTVCTPSSVFFGSFTDKPDP
jgi:hypothetical protein